MEEIQTKSKMAVDWRKMNDLIEADFDQMMVVVESEEDLATYLQQLQVVDVVISSN